LPNLAINHIKKSNMFKVTTADSLHFDELASLQYGWDFTVSQLGPSNEVSRVSFCQSTHVGLNKFRYGTAYDQRLIAKKGLLSFGLLDADNPPTWTHDQLIPNSALTVFPRDEEMRGSSPEGFRGNGVHFAEDFMAGLAAEVFRRPLNQLIPEGGIFVLKPEKLAVLREELGNWRQLENFNARIPQAIILRREESLALAVFNALIDEQYDEDEPPGRSQLSLSRALEMIHHGDLENISARELCAQAQCSQRTLEKSFFKRFGVTPKKYIKCLRLASVHQGLRTFSTQDCTSIIELAGINGFWHMGQFAADYRRIYGELPSETLSRS
jgi:AraC family ethanolamine operon transcriptional activator